MLMAANMPVPKKFLLMDGGLMKEKISKSVKCYRPAFND